VYFRVLFLQSVRATGQLVVRNFLLLNFYFSASATSIDMTIIINKMLIVVVVASVVLAVIVNISIILF
jgi:hypothetical protein